MSKVPQVLLFKDYHQWDSALGIGLAQCAGDLTAAFFMKILPGRGSTPWQPRDWSASPAAGDVHEGDHHWKTTGLLSLLRADQLRQDSAQQVMAPGFPMS